MIAWLLGASLALAQSDGLWLNDVLASVEASHPLLDAERAGLDVAQARQRSAAGAFDPALAAGAGRQVGEYSTQSLSVKSPLGTAWGGSVSVGWERGVGTFDPYEGALKTAPMGEWVAGVDLPLLRDAWTDARRASLRASRQGVTMAGATVEARRLDLLRSGGSRWVDWVRAGQGLAIARRMLKVAEDRDRAFSVQESLGDAAMFLVLDNRRLVIERRDRLVVAERALEQAAIALSVSLRDADGKPIVPSESALPRDFEPASGIFFDDPTAVALAGRPELRRLDAAAEQLEIQRRLMGNQALPALDLRAKYYRPLEEGYDEQIDVGVVAEWFVPARKARADGAAARAGRVKLLEERRFAQDLVQADVNDALSAVRTAVQRVEVARELVAMAREVERLERERFVLGDSNLIFVNQRELATADAELALIDAIAGTHRATLDLRWATATLAAP